jgi:hypothetical protein
MKTILAWLLVAAIFVAGLAAVVLLQTNAREHRLADGSILRLEKITYGKRERIYLGGWLEQLKQRLPQPLVQRFFKPSPGSRGNSSWWQNTAMQTNNDALYIYVSRRDAALGNYQDVGAQSAQLLDDDGCVFLQTQAGGEDNGLLSRSMTGMAGTGMGSSVNWFRFEAFPRRQRKFQLRLFDQTGKKLGEFTIRNPAPPPPPTNWPVAVLPITFTNGDTAFTLAQVTIKSNSNRAWRLESRNPMSIAPKYEIIEHGQPSTNWQALDLELYDSTGNFAAEMGAERWLCPREPAWKLRVKFFASEEANTSSNTVWTLRGIEVPGPGKYVRLYSAQDLAGVPLKAVTLGGPGDFVYRDGEPVEAAPLKELFDKSSLSENWNNNGRNANMSTYTTHGTNHHLCVEVGDLTDDQRLTIRALDAQGRSYYAEEWFEWRTAEPSRLQPGEIHYLGKRYSQQAPFFTLDLPADCKTVDLDFCVHSCFAPEYIFKPPLIKSASAR